MTPRSWRTISRRLRRLSAVRRPTTLGPRGRGASARVAQPRRQAPGRTRTGTASSTAGVCWATSLRSTKNHRRSGTAWTFPAPATTAKPPRRGERATPRARAARRSEARSRSAEAGTLWRSRICRYRRRSSAGSPSASCCTPCAPSTGTSTRGRPSVTGSPTSAPPTRSPASRCRCRTSLGTRRSRRASRNSWRSTARSPSNPPAAPTPATNSRAPPRLTPRPRARPTMMTCTISSHNFEGACVRARARACATRSSGRVRAPQRCFSPS
mmetsp:Transcript_16000/g.48875  ORF Transcript_16000/g.48875 Transcript_16000/m.48875 type:complete len:269 (+) Transcript_16000:1387-2193(+)